MSQHMTHKRTAQGKAQTIARRTARQSKRTDYTGYIPVLTSAGSYTIAGR